MSGPANLGDALVEAGLLLFGRFVHGGEPRPFRHHLAMLASYPVLLKAMAEQLAGPVQGADRLLCRTECLPLGVAVSLETQIPLVIAAGDGHDGARDFVGAYDIGHPAALLTHSLDDFPDLLIRHARRVGLEIDRVCAVLAPGPIELPVSGHALIQLRELVAHLVDSKHLPAGQGRAVTAWLEESAANRPHRG